MEQEIITVLVILGLTVIMLVLDVVRIDIVAIGCMLALGWSGILDTQEMFSGFSSNAVIAMLSVMILGSGISRSGVMDKFSQFIIDKAGTRKRNLIGLLSASVGLLSGVIQNIGAAALFLPGIIQVSRKTKIPMSSLIMPIGYAAILGGALTMVGSGHLILVNDMLKNDGYDAYNLLSVTPIGIILLISGILYFLFLGDKVLPSNEVDNTGKSEQEKLIDKLSLPHAIKRVKIAADSLLVGQTIEEAGLEQQFNIHLLGLRTDKDVVFAPWRETELKDGQILAVLSTGENLEQFIEECKLQDVSSSNYFYDDFKSESSGFAELIIPPDSELVGNTIRDYAFRKRHAAKPVVLFNKGERSEGDFSDTQIASGDTLIIYGRWKEIENLKSSKNVILLTDVKFDDKDTSKTWPAIGCFVFAIALAMFGFSISMAFLTGALLMVLTRVMNISQAYEAVEWRVVFMLAGLIPLGIAMQKTGAALFLAEKVMYVVIDLPPIFMIIMVCVLATLFSLFMTNVGVVVVLAPLVIGMASIADMDARPLVLMAALCAGNSFILPTHQVNAFLMSSGGYRNADYIRAGSGMTVIFLAITVSIFYFFII